MTLMGPCELSPQASRCSAIPPPPVRVWVQGAPRLPGSPEPGKGQFSCECPQQETILRLVCANVFFFFFFYFHIYITRCPLTGPNSKVAPFCVLRTQKSRYCTFTKAPCFCKSRL